MTSESKNAPRDPHMNFNLPTFGDIRFRPECPISAQIGSKYREKVGRDIVSSIPGGC